ncbi:MAG: hypothetical protein ACTSVY_16370 [Candidatus Helarchaeota archaeon]
MTNDQYREYYNSIKEFQGQKYTGMKVGSKHSWNYKDGTWNEFKVTPNKWKFKFICNKYRKHQAPKGTGAQPRTEYHWYIVADQKVVKLDENTYQTTMTGVKFKIGHKRPNWKFWSYDYNEESPEDKIINILEQIIKDLKAKKNKKELIAIL